MAAEEEPVILWESFLAATGPLYCTWVTYTTGDDTPTITALDALDMGYIFGARVAAVSCEDRWVPLLPILGTRGYLSNIKGFWSELHRRLEWYQPPPGSG